MTAKKSLFIQCRWSLGQAALLLITAVLWATPAIAVDIPVLGSNCDQEQPNGTNVYGQFNGGCNDPACEALVCTGNGDGFFLGCISNGGEIICNVAIGATPYCCYEPVYGDTGVRGWDSACADTAAYNCSASCGDGVFGLDESGTQEGCDDGNNFDLDGCSASCILEVCGDGVLNNAGNEQCDDGNLNSGDGCSNTCTIEAATCGDGIVAVGEECDDGNNTTGDGCSEICQIEELGCTVNADCDDGLYCNGAETCFESVCQPGLRVNCVSDQCNIFACNEDTDSCTLSTQLPDSTPCNDGNACTSPDYCEGGLCTGLTLPCRGDFNECTTSECQVQEGSPVCVEINVQGSCDDGDACTTGDFCEEGTCIASAELDCDNDLYCDGAETCDAKLGCQPGEAPNADDGVTCTNDSCDEDKDIIVHTADDAKCDNGMYCDGAETCDATFDCQPGTPVDMNDDVACTNDSCDEDKDIIVHTADDTKCDNDMYCDGTEICDATLGCQTGTPVDCGPGDQCNNNECDEDNDECSFVPVADSTPCEDGYACTSATGTALTQDQCSSGVCTGIAVVCDDDTQNACTDPDTCDPVDGACLANNKACASVTDSGLCVFDVSTKGVCVDGDDLTGEACDEADICFGGACAVTGVSCVSDTDCNAECSSGTCVPENQFKLIFTPDGKIWPGFKLNASNPGQTFYNLVYTGDPKVLTITIPYPYVTVGGTPVHVYDGAEVGNVPGDDCFDPPAETLAGGALSTQWTIDDWIDGGANNPEVDCTPVCGPNGAGYCTFEVDLTTMEEPDSGEYYVNVHLDYGLEGVHLDANLCDDGLVDRYDVGTFSRWGQADAGVPTGGVLLSAHAFVDDDTDSLSVLGLADCRDHVFSYSDGQTTFSDTVQNLNIFKGISGAFGLVRSSLTGDGYEGNILTLAKLSNPATIMKETVTDEDGAYTLVYKHKGKPTLYLLELYDPSGTELLGSIVFELQGNGWTQIEFDPDGDPCNIDSAYCECNGWCAAAEYGSGRQSSGGNDGGDGAGGVCELAQTGESCTIDSECCSSACKGKPGEKTCK